MLDVLRACGCSAPTKRANGLIDWLGGSAGSVAGWVHVDAELAGAEVARGHPVVVAYRAPDGQTGHVAILLPSYATGLRIAQAGRSNYFDVPVARGFGVRPVRFFAHA